MRNLQRMRYVPLPLFSPFYQKKRKKRKEKKRKEKKRKEKRGKLTRFSHHQSAALLNAIKDYETNKWKVIGQKVGKPAKVSS